MITYMWQEQYGQPYFRFQTNDPKIARKMRRRKNFRLVVYGLNRRIWVFITQSYSPKTARRTLQRLTGHKVKEDGSDRLFFAETGAIVTPKLRY